MTGPNCDALTVDELVSRFAAIGAEQERAVTADNNTKYNKLFSQITAVVKHLKALPGDQRRALLGLYEHPSIQVRLMAAKYTLAIAPRKARQALESIAASRLYPQAGDAGMYLTMLDRGIFVPD